LAELAEERRLSEERREAEARAAAERELTPPGCRLLSELERHAGARLLQAALAAGHAEQAAFPLAVNFSAARERRRGALDDRVVRHCCAGTRFEFVSLPAGDTCLQKRLEEALALFARPLVYLPLSTAAPTEEEVRGL